MQNPPFNPAACLSWDAPLSLGARGQRPRCFVLRSMFFSLGNAWLKLTCTVPFLKRGTFRGHSRKVFGQRRPRSTLWVPSGSMDAPNDREAPGANPDRLHCGPARRTWARAWSCMDTRHGAVHHEPARAPPWLPAARQVPLGPLGTAPPLMDLALAVSEFAGARRGANGGPRAQNPFFAFSIDP